MYCTFQAERLTCRHNTGASSVNHLVPYTSDRRTLENFKLYTIKYAWEGDTDYTLCSFVFGCDTPACRKAAGFLSHSATLGCCKGLKKFPRPFGCEDYSEMMSILFLAEGEEQWLSLLSATQLLGCAILTPCIILPWVSKMKSSGKNARYIFPEKKMRVQFSHDTGGVHG